MNDDPRGFGRAGVDFRYYGTRRNTHSVDPNDTLVRPDMRVHVGSPHVTKFSKRLKHDDVVIAPELFGPEDNWDNYYKLIDEVCAMQQGGGSRGDKHTGNSEWVTWHEGAT